MDREIKKFDSVNAKLTELYEIKNKKSKNGENEIEMIEEKNEIRGKFFLIQIHLSELFPDDDSHLIINQPASPHEIILGLLKGVPKYREYYIYNKNIFNEIGRYVTPNLNKHAWFLEEDLVEKSLLTVYARMNTSEMTKMLRQSPIPAIRFFPSKYNIDMPEDFETLVNSLNKKEMQSLDFVPYLREKSKRQIQSHCLYRLEGKIKLVENNNRKNHHLSHLSELGAVLPKRRLSSNFKETLLESLDQRDIDSIDGMISNVILDLTILDYVEQYNDDNRIKYLTSIPSNDLYSIVYDDDYYDSIILPVNYDNTHWILLIFEFKNPKQDNDKKVLHILDPSRGSISYIEETFLRKMTADGWTIDIHSHDIDRQTSGTLDCGIYVMSYAENFIRYNTFKGIDSNTIAKKRHDLKEIFKEKIRL